MDQDKALAWMEYERTRCPRCGTFPDEWLDEEGIPHDVDPYQVYSVRCLGCVTMGDEMEAAKNDSVGLSFYMIPRRYVKDTNVG